MLRSANRRVHRGGLLRGWAEPAPALGPERVLEHGSSGFLLPSAGRAHLEAITEAAGTEAEWKSVRKLEVLTQEFSHGRF